MHVKTVLAVPLSALFTSLLTGCPLPFGCDSDTINTESKVELTPAEYEQWKLGMMPGASTGAPTTGDATSDGGSTSGGTGDGSTGGGSTGDMTTTGTTSGDATTGELSTEEACTAVCKDQFGDTELASCTVDEQADKVVVTCNLVQQCIGGRGHACVRPLGVAAGPDPGAAWLARIAHDEAASVHAFRSLARELASLGAPAGLIARIEAAADDEVRHAAITSSLAQDRGAAVPAPACVPLPARGLLELALENAVEGCVHETWAALSAAHQARGAADPALRAVFAGIADDEARHAELAWAIDAWLSSQLDAADRAAVAAARRAAVTRLRAQLEVAADEPELLALGVPPAGAAARLCAGLDAALWSRAA